MMAILCYTQPTPPHRDEGLDLPYAFPQRRNLRCGVHSAWVRLARGWGKTGVTHWLLRRVGRGFGEGLTTRGGQHV
jgi:hypothetical protein